VSRRRQAQAARWQLELVLDFAGWPWSQRLSFWLDALVILEEAAGRMNRHLQVLLSPVYDGALAPEHLADLRKSTLDDKMIREQFIRSVPPAMIEPLLGFDRPEIRSALLLPFRSPAGGIMDHVRVKVFPALTDAKGHSVKYLQPKRSAPRLYFVARCLERVVESDEPVWITEGEKKACAVAQLGFPVIGITGVTAWHGKGHCDLLPDFDAIPLVDRAVELLPDTDYQTNADVALAINGLARALGARGAKPFVRLLPLEQPQ
jgi:uncharacterized protein DUF3854